MEEVVRKQTERDLRLKYKSKIGEVVRLNLKSLTLKHSDLTNNELADWVVTHKNWADQHVREALLDFGVKVDVVKNLTIRYVGLPSQSTIRNLKSDLIGQTRSFDGIIRRVSEIRSKAIVAVFECSSCTTRVRERQDEDVLTHPDPKCPSCRKTARWKIVPEGGEYIDYQQITVQEYPEGIRGGEQPKSVVVTLTGDICGTVVPGNRVTVCGTLKLKQLQFKTTDIAFVFEPYIEGNSIILKDENYENIYISDNDLVQIKQLSETPDLLDKIAKSIAPTIYGHEEVKRGITLQLFGGVPKFIEKTRIRGDIHVLLIGDPGIAKSVIMKYVVDISPRGIFTHGNSSSKAGLTATAIKENDQWVLEAGALVLADLGLCAVDELDKMVDTDRESLHGAMEQQEIDIAKAGIVAKLLTRCSLLGAANPKLGRFDLHQSLSQQFNLPPTLISRFDLIYTMTDIPEENRDSEIADHILTTHTTERVSTEIIPADLLRKYIAHSKTVNPKLTKEAADVLKKYYTKVRALANNMQTVPITARSLEALIRLSEASARMRLSEVVSPDDAKLVVTIVDGCLRQIAYDANTSTWDIDRVISRYPKRMRDMFSRITDAILIVADNDTARIADVVRYIEGKYGIKETEIVAHLEVMRSETKVFFPKEGYVKILK